MNQPFTNPALRYETTGIFAGISLIKHTSNFQLGLHTHFLWTKFNMRGIGEGEIVKLTKKTVYLKNIHRQILSFSIDSIVTILSLYEPKKENFPKI
jgi:hypothetical protein